MLPRTTTAKGAIAGVLAAFSALMAVGARAYGEPASPPAATQNAAEPSPGTSAPVAGLEDIGLLEMEVPTVITGTRHRQAMATAPYAVSVVTAQDIRDSGARSVPDALRLVPGMDVADISHSVSAVSPRGMTRYLSNQVLVLVDGRQVYDSMFGGTEWVAWPFQLEDIERIEVVRGSGGVTWGTNVVNGVINIVTKDPVDQLGLTTIASGGSQGTAKEYTGYAFADKKLRMRVSGEYERTDGFERGGSFLFPFDDKSNAGRANVHALYDIGERDRLMVSAGSGLRDGGLSPSPFSGYRRRDTVGPQANFVLGRWTHDVADDNTIDVTAYVNDLMFTQGIREEFRYEQGVVQLGHTFKPADNHTLTWGIDTRAEYLDGSLADPYILTEDYVSTGLIGAYVQDDWKFAPKWALNLGARMDYEFYNGFQPSGRAAISYEPAPDSLVYAAVSNGFMLPALGDRFQNEPLLRNLGRLTSHVDMSPTTAVTYELGYRTKLFKRLEANVDVFWNEYNDWPTGDPRLGPPGFFRLDYDTRSSASMYGVEVGAKYAATKNLTLLGNYTFERLNYRGTWHPSMEADINVPPKHKFMVGARYSPLSDLHLSAHLYYVDAVTAPNSTLSFFPRHIPAYFRLDLRGEYEFWKKQASIAVGVRNLLDANHREGGTLFLNDAEVPRMVYAELRLSFK